MLPCFVLCWIWNQQWSYNTALHKQTGLWVNCPNQKALGFSRLSFLRKKHILQPVIFASLSFLPGQTNNIYVQYFLSQKKKENKNKVGVWGEQGNRVLLCGHEWLGTCYIDQTVLELMGDPASACHCAQLMYFWSDNKVAWTPSGSWGTWQW